MMKIVGVAEMGLSTSPDQVLITYSLGSCIAIVIFDPVVRVGGMLHFMLPEAAMDPEKAKINPSLFADTGIPQLFKRSYQLGARKENLIVKAAGGAQILDDDGFFNIGKRNYVAMRNIFWRNNVMLASEHIGGNVNRTIRLEMNTGRVFMKVQAGADMEL